jgi:hypothetical protein
MPEIPRNGQQQRHCIVTNVTQDTRLIVRTSQISLDPFQTWNLQDANTSQKCEQLPGSTNLNIIDELLVEQQQGSCLFRYSHKKRNTNLKRERETPHKIRKK